MSPQGRVRSASSGRALRTLNLIELIELYGKPELALAHIQQEATEGERSDILPIGLHAVGCQTEANAALEPLVQKFGDTDAYWMATNCAYWGDALVRLGCGLLEPAHAPADRERELMGEEVSRGPGPRGWLPRDVHRWRANCIGAEIHVRQRSLSRYYMHLWQLGLSPKRYPSDP